MIFEIVVASVIAFASTNIDDIFILILFFSDKRFRAIEVVGGQFLGIILLVSVSLIGSLIGLIPDETYVGLLGLIPVCLGIKGLWQQLNGRVNDEQIADGELNSGNNVFAVAGVTFANGGDNIGIYVPLFATLPWAHTVTMIVIFMVMTFVWCFLATYLARHPYVRARVDRYGHWLTPFVLILLGLYILVDSRSFTLLPW
ncbi:MAG TPA: cadmium resistance transporter [Chryseosolibacter sp.]|nr:cadmium resistance transporter [Chryseosolibacter sp.]